MRPTTMLAILFLSGCDVWVTWKDWEDARPSCDDTDPDRATEWACEEVGCPDEEPLLTLFLDEDGDGYGDPQELVTTCDEIAGYVANDLDCDDDRADVSPAAGEVLCNGVNDDCDDETPDRSDTDTDTGC